MMKCVCLDLSNNPIKICPEIYGTPCRERLVMPTIDDIVSELNGAKVFSKLDLNDGYHQLELDEESRSVTTNTCGSLQI